MRGQDGDEETPEPDGAVEAEGPGASAFAGLWLAYSVLAFFVYYPSLSGAFISDDYGYIVTNPYIQSLSWKNFVAILDPWGGPALYTVNYAPVDLYAHSLEWAVFGAQTPGYRVVNLLLHAGVSTAIALLFTKRGLPLAWAAGAGLVLLVHPANVQAVAWIFQLKTLLCLLFGVAALLLHPHRPALATGCFALGLLSKASALFAWPVAVAFTWTLWSSADGDDRGWRRHWPWLVLWGVVLGLYAGPQLFTFQRLGAVDPALHADAWVTVRSIAAIGARYVVIAASSYGVSAWHEPPPADSWLDPWWLLGLALGVAVVARVLFALWRRDEEAVYWVWAGAAWLPISQVFPFLYPMADHYLYCILPGLVGAGLWAASPLWGTAPEPVTSRAATVTRASAAALLVLCAFFAVHSWQRAQIWVSDAHVSADAARNYPDGKAGHLLAARRAAQRFATDEAIDHLEMAAARGFDRFSALGEHPAFASLAGDPRFVALQRELAGRWIERSEQLPDPTQADLRLRAQAHLVRDELREAEQCLASALELDGWLTADIERELAAVRALRLERGAVGPKP